MWSGSLHLITCQQNAEIGEVSPNDYVIDLGSGDGRTVITAAKIGAKATGIEYNPDMVAFSKRMQKKRESAKRRN